MKPILEDIPYIFPVSSHPEYVVYAQAIVQVLDYYIKAEEAGQGLTIVFEGRS